jgi:hypothetical protein
MPVTLPIKRLRPADSSKKNLRRQGAVFKPLKGVSQGKPHVEISMLFRLMARFCGQGRAGKKAGLPFHVSMPLQISPDVPK